MPSINFARSASRLGPIAAEEHRDDEGVDRGDHSYVQILRQHRLKHG
jgi:hypothetical protein